MALFGLHKGEFQMKNIRIALAAALFLPTAAWAQVAPDAWPEPLL